MQNPYSIFPEIESSDLLLRKIKEEDLPDLLKIYSEKKRQSFLITLPLLVTLLTGCHGYRSKYDAKFLVQSNSGTEATLDFAEFKGKIVFDLRRTSKGEGTISYTASLEEGTIKVYYYDVFMDVESELFIIGGGQELSDKWGYVESGRKYLIIVESYGVAIDGNFTFNINSY